jgi:hypothetical protein
MTRNSRAEAIDELSAWNVAGGVLSMALFPLAIPLLLLTAVFVIPLLLIPLAGALILAVLAAPVLLLWTLGRRAMRALRRPSTPVESRRDARSLPTGSPPAKA